MKKITTLIIALVLTLGLSAQEELSQPKPIDFSISFVPQYMITGGMRTDFDFQIKDKTWLTLGPTFYYMDGSYMWSPDETNFLGVGLFANYRYFPSGSGIYMGLGLNYRFLDVDYYKYDVEAKQYAKFSTFGFDYMFGYQMALVEQLFLDLYIGWGFRYSDEDSNENSAYWSGAILDLGYSGFVPVTGLRVGFEF